MKTVEGVVQMGAAVVDTATSVVVYPYEVVDHGLVKGTAQTVEKWVHEGGVLVTNVLYTPVNIMLDIASLF